MIQSGNPSRVVHERRSRFQRARVERVGCEPLVFLQHPIPVYSPYGAEGVITPEQACALYTYIEHGDLAEAPNTYPALPWLMEDLPGTTWRNIFTGAEVRLTHLALDGGREISLFGEYHTRCGFVSRELGLGFWLAGRYVVEHWVRTDLWPAADLIPWLRWESRNISAHIAHLDELIVGAQRDGDTINHRAYKQDRDRRILDLQWQRHQLVVFAATHGFPLPC